MRGLGNEQGKKNFKCQTTNVQKIKRLLVGKENVGKKGIKKKQRCVTWRSPAPGQNRGSFMFQLVLHIYTPVYPIHQPNKTALQGWILLNMALDVWESPQISYKSSKPIHLAQVESKSYICLESLEKDKKQLIKYYNYLLIKTML